MSKTGAKFAPERKEKNPFLNQSWFDDMNARMNKDFGLYEFYQVNPYTKKTLDFVTPKITERRPKIDPKCVPGYETIKSAIRKATASPQETYIEPQTEQMRLGWYEQGQGYFDRENYDDRFNFSHKTADFIKTQALIRDYDNVMKSLTALKPKK